VSNNISKHIKTTEAIMCWNHL